MNENGVLFKQSSCGWNVTDWQQRSDWWLSGGAYDFRVLRDLTLSFIYPAHFFSEQDMSCQPKKQTVVYILSALCVSSQWASASPATLGLPCLIL